MSRQLEELKTLMQATKIRSEWRSCWRRRLISESGAPKAVCFSDQSVWYRGSTRIRLPRMTDESGCAIGAGATARDMADSEAI